MKTVIAVSLLIVLPVIASAQSPRTAAVARTAWGDPDLQGVWDYGTITPMERPDEFAGKEVLTIEEAAKLEAEAVRNFANADRRPPEGSVGGYNLFWRDYRSNVVAGRRTVVGCGSTGWETPSPQTAGFRADWLDPGRLAGTTTYSVPLRRGRD